MKNVIIFYLYNIIINYELLSYMYFQFDEVLLVATASRAHNQKPSVEDKNN